jgi:2,4-dienoyl-CoA reductase-like NADH-dependent reductase (Old Yellow Enzyme family)
MPDLFSPFTLKGVTPRNRIAMSPMTIYRSVDGKMDGRTSVGGAGI